MQFVEEAGVQYEFKLVSRHVDSLAKIDFDPEGIDESLPEQTRMSGIKFEREKNYFIHTFYYTQPKNSHLVNIEFVGADSTYVKPNELVILINKLP